MTTTKRIVISGAGSGAPNADIDTNIYHYDTIVNAAADLFDYNSPRQLLSVDEAWSIKTLPWTNQDKLMFDPASPPGSSIWDATNKILKILPACEGDATRNITIESMFGYSAYNKRFPLRDYGWRRWAAPSNSGMGIVSLAQNTVFQNIHMDGIAIYTCPGTTYSIAGGFDNTFTGAGSALTLNRLTARPEFFDGQPFLHAFQNGSRGINQLEIVAFACWVFDLSIGGGRAFLGDSDGDAHCRTEHCNVLYRTTPVHQGFGFCLPKNCVAAGQTAGDGSRPAYASVTGYQKCASSDSTGSESGLRSKTVSDLFGDTVSAAICALSADSDTAWQGFAKAAGTLVDAGVNLSRTVDGNGAALNAPTTPTIGAFDVKSLQATDPGLASIVSSLRGGDPTRSYFFPLARGGIAPQNDGVNVQSSGVKSIGGQYGGFVFNHNGDAATVCDGHGASWDNRSDYFNAEGVGSVEVRRWRQDATITRPTTNGSSGPRHTDGTTPAAHYYAGGRGAFPTDGTLLIKPVFTADNADWATDSSGKSRLYEHNIQTGALTANYPQATVSGDKPNWAWSEPNSAQWLLTTLDGSGADWWLYLVDGAPGSRAATLKKHTTDTGLFGAGVEHQMCNMGEALFVATSGGKIAYLDVSNPASIGSWVDVTANCTNLPTRTNKRGWDYNQGDGMLYCYTGQQLLRATKADVISGSSFTFEEVPLDWDDELSSGLLYGHEDVGAGADGDRYLSLVYSPDIGGTGQDGFFIGWTGDWHQGVLLLAQEAGSSPTIPFGIFQRVAA